MNQQTDEEMMASYQTGNEQALRVLFERYKRRILNFCLQLLANRADAEEVAGDVFISVITHKQSFDPGRRFSTWIYTIARNKCISRMRRRRPVFSLWGSQTESVGNIWEIADESRMARDDLNRKEMRQYVRDAIRELPDEQRQAILLREFHRMSYAEISEVMDCSLEKVKILIYRGREQLRRRLASLLAEDQP